MEALGIPPRRSLSLSLCIYVCVRERSRWELSASSARPPNYAVLRGFRVEDCARMPSSVTTLRYYVLPGGG